MSLPTIAWHRWMSERASRSALAVRTVVPGSSSIKPAFLMALGVILALWLAMWLQLDAPYWAGATVLITFQATRGQSLLKGVNRLVGTLFGTIAGVGLIALFPQQWWSYVLVHAVWLTLCTAFACWLTPARAYAAALSGYTALIVAFDSFGAPQQAFDTAISRASSISIGVVVFTLIYRVLEPSRDAAVLRHALHGWRREGLALLDGLDDGSRRPEDLSRYLVRLADFDELLEEGAAEAFWVSRAKPSLRGAVLALVDVLMMTAAASEGQAAAPARSAAITAKLREAEAGFAVLRRPHRAVAGARVGRAADHDWRVVVDGSIRSACCFGLACACWIETRWPGGSTFASIAGILCGLFSFRPEAVAATRKFVIGTLAAAVVATWIGLFVLPDVSTFEGLSFVLFPFLFAGALGIRTPALSGYAAPFNLLFLTMIGVRNVMSYDALSFFNEIEATLTGALFAAAWFRIRPPLSKEARLAGLRRRMRRDRLATRDHFLDEAEQRLLYLQRLGAILRLADPAEGKAVFDHALTFWRA